MKLTHYIAQSFLRYKILYKIYNFIFIIITKLSLTNEERKKVKEWESLSINDKPLRNKKYIIYSPTLSKNLVNYYLSQIYFLTIFKKLGNIPLIINPGIFKKVYKKLGFETLEHPYHYLNNQDIQIIKKKDKNF